MHIQEIYTQNIRSITDKVELNLNENDNFIRIGGRNGRGKSTVISIGMKILLGLTPAKPHLTKGHKKGYYIVRNSKGLFGVNIYEKGNAEYHYELNDGEKGSSRDTLNHNRILPIIRANIGFDIDEENTGALNINENTRLNFVSTNGRTDLAFLKNLLYSEEIEKLQKDTKETIETSKKILERNSNEIVLLIEDRTAIKTVDKSYVKELLSYAETIEIQNNAINLLNKTYFDIIRINLIKRHTSNLETIGTLETLKLSVNGMAKSKLWLETQNKVLNGITLLSNLKTIRDTSMLTFYTKQHLTKELSNQSLNKLEGLKQLVKESYKLKLKPLSIDKEVKDIKKYIYIGMKVKQLELENSKQQYVEFLSTIKKRKVINTSLAIQMNYNLIGHLNDNLHFLNCRLKQSIMLPFVTYTTINQEIKGYLKLKNDISEQEDILDDLIYKDGRCVLCLKEK